MLSVGRKLTDTTINTAVWEWVLPEDDWETGRWDDMLRVTPGYVVLVFITRSCCMKLGSARGSRVTSYVEQKLQQ